MRRNSGKRKAELHNETPLQYSAAVPDLAHALSIAIAAAEAAEKILLKHFRKDLHISTKSSPRDLVTQVDREAQAAIIEVILKEFPDHGFITEETVDSEHAARLQKNAQSRYQWIIDPLDGTTNFIHGKKEFGTMIALWECPNAANIDEPLKNTTPLLGIIHQPLEQRRFEGIRGKGAFVCLDASALLSTSSTSRVISRVTPSTQCEGCIEGSRLVTRHDTTPKNIVENPLKLRITKNMLDAILCTNMVARGKPDEKDMLQVAVPYCGSLHNYGCAAFEQGAILLGENDGVFYDGVGLWDFAAAALLIEEAGGKVRWESKDPKDIRSKVRCVASTAPIFKELCAFLFGE
mgnify:CR=1 FL=1